MYCPHCGKESLSSAEYCSHCGKKINDSPAGEDNKQNTENDHKPRNSHPTLTIFILFLVSLVGHVTLAAFLTGTKGAIDTVNVIFSLLYFFLFIMFIVSLFRKPKQVSSEIVKNDSSEKPKSEQQKHPGRWKWYLSFILFIFLPILYLIITGPGVINPAFGTIAILIPIIFFAWFVWYLFKRNKEKNISFFQTFKNLFDFSKNHLKLAIPLTVVFLILIVFIYGLIVAINDDYFKSIEQTVSIIQDSLSDAAAAKIMGDSIYKGKYMPGATWTQVQTNAKNDADILASLSVPSSLTSYRQVALDWTNQIAKAPQTYTWNKVNGQPADFVIRLNDEQVKKLLQTSYQKISELKALGENAIERKDRETMRYIAAKLLVQEHWLKGIQHSKKTSLFGFKLVNTAYAATYSDQDCINIALSCAQRCAFSDDTMSCVQPCANEIEAYCSGANKPKHQPTSPPEEPTQPPQPQKTEVPTQKPEEPTATPTPYTYEPTPRNDTCVPGKTGSYCAAAAVQAVNEIAASSANFAQGADLSVDNWNKMFQPFDDLFPNEHLLDGAGVTQGEPDAIYVPPIVQTFNNECAARGGRTDNPSVYMSRLPTTESGYFCSYQIGGNNCLDFLTYSGGRYLGGNPGCPERNLVPIVNNAPAINPPPPAAQKADWNGTYDIVSWSVNKECTNKNRPYSFTVNGNVVNNPSGWGNNNPSIEQAGAANCSDKSCSYQFYGSGNKAYMTGTGTESASACLKKSNCNLCQFKITAKHR